MPNNDKSKGQLYSNRLISYWWQYDELMNMVSLRNNLSRNLDDARKSVFLDSKILGWAYRKRIEDLEGLIEAHNDTIRDLIHQIEVEDGVQIVLQDGINGKIL